MAGSSKPSAPKKKSIHVPEPGEFLTDGKRLVEVVGKERDGIRVLDVTAALDPDDCDPRALLLLPVKEAVEKWRLVEPEHARA